VGRSTPDKRGAQIDAAVAAIFAQYPYRAAR
jgi:hypothetical protein